MAEDSAFRFGGMMDERSMVCRVEELAIFASPICHQGANPLNTKSAIIPLIMDRSSPNFFVGSSIKVILSRLAFLADCE
jgi:hypothetical protein